MSAPALRRNQAVPPEPTLVTSPTESAEPSWTDTMATMASPQGGMAGCALVMDLWASSAGPLPGWRR